MRKWFKGKRGIAESGVLFMLVTIVGTLAAKGILYSGGSLVSSNVIAVSSVLTAYSQMPHVKDNFRRTKAVKMCEEEGEEQCAEMVESWSDEDVLDYIRDDEVPETLFSANGGNFTNGNMY